MTKKVFFASKRRKPIKPQPVTLREFYDRKEKILIFRAVGGLGDILMHRMIFEDFKKIDPNVKIVFATLPCYFDALRDHPFIDELVNSNDVDLTQYNVSYNTTSACCRYEIMTAPNSGLHRSDIWSNHCGVKLKNHNMHLTISPEGLAYGMKTVEHYRQGNQPVVLLCPISAMVAKNLLPEQMQGVVERLRAMNCCVIASHTKSVPKLIEMNVPIISTNVQQLFGLVKACDYIISVDTSQIHIAGGLKKPAVGIFTFADGKVYTKFYSSCELVQKHRDSGDWDCGPCYNYPNCTKCKGLPKPCLTEITVDMIMDGVKKMMAKYPYNTILGGYNIGK